MNEQEQQTRGEEMNRARGLLTAETVAKTGNTDVIDGDIAKPIQIIT